MTHPLLITGILLAAIGSTRSAVPPSRPPALPPSRRLGLEVLLTDSLHLVRGRRVGLVANYATVDRDGAHAIERLRASGVTLVALMSPEHGFRGSADPGEAVATTVDSATGLPIYSLYGKHLAPGPEVLRDLDVVLVDLPDVGTRYFTYLSTAVEVMKAAAQAGRPVLVLDRPNPLGGVVQGPVLESAFSSFIGRLAIPSRHGLTLGEQALLANADLGLGATVTVIPTQGWRRRDDAYVTGLPFLPPSPNLKDLESLFHYPGTCLFEGTALSVGRGTDAPFKQIGAPWLDTVAVLRIVRRARLPGIEFAGAPFTPRQPGDAKFPETAVAGIQLRMTDRRTYDPIRTAVVLLEAVQAVHPDKIGFLAAHFDRLAGSSTLRNDIQAGKAPHRILAGWQRGLRAYLARRFRFLLYS